jgi:molybdate transport system ATP-binding protein
LSGLHLDIKIPLERFAVEVRWESLERSLGIFGHSGAGKTTILEAIAGLRPQARGSIEVWGAKWLDSEAGLNLPPERRRVGYVPQDTLLFPHLDVLGNLLSGARRAGNRFIPKTPPEKVLEVLELEPLKRAKVTELSGGERQRVALGRALCSGPGLLLLDEPLAGLDLPLRRRILSYLLRVREEFELPTIYVSHDATEMSILSGEVLVLSEGRRVARGRPEKVFLDTGVLPMFREEGFENVLEARPLDTRESGLLVEIDPGLTVLVAAPGAAGGGKVLFGLRAEDILLATRPPEGISAQNVLPGIVREVREDGAGEKDGGVMVLVTLGRGQRRIAALITKQARVRLGLREGMEVNLVFKAQSCRVLAVQ